MTKEHILTEFKGFDLTDKQIDKILAFYKAGAELLSVTVKEGMLTDAMPLKLTLNTLKHSVVQILEISNAQKKNTLPDS